jgi:hypothetical protein
VKLFEFPEMAKKSVSTTVEGKCYATILIARQLTQVHTVLPVRIKTEFEGLKRRLISL